MIHIGYGGRRRLIQAAIACPITSRTCAYLNRKQDLRLPDREEYYVFSALYKNGRLTSIR